MDTQQEQPALLMTEPGPWHDATEVPPSDGWYERECTEDGEFALVLWTASIGKWLPQITSETMRYSGKKMDIDDKRWRIPAMNSVADRNLLDDWHRARPHYSKGWREGFDAGRAYAEKYGTPAS